MCTRALTSFIPNDLKLEMISCPSTQSTTCNIAVHVSQTLCYEVSHHPDDCRVHDFINTTSTHRYRITSVVAPGWVLGGRMMAQVCEGLLSQQEVFIP